WLLDAIVAARLATESPPTPPPPGWSRSVGRWMLVGVAVIAAGRRFVVGEPLHGVVDLAVCGLLVVWLLAPAGAHRILKAPVPTLPLPWWPAVRDYLANTWVPLSVLLVLPALRDIGERFWEPLGVVLGFAAAWLVAGLIWAGNALRPEESP